MVRKNPLLAYLQGSNSRQYAISQVKDTVEACTVLLTRIVKCKDPLNTDDYSVIENCRESLTMITLGDIVGCDSNNFVEFLGKAATVLMTQKVKFDCGDTEDKSKIQEAISYLKEIADQR